MIDNVSSRVLFSELNVSRRVTSLPLTDQQMATNRVLRKREKSREEGELTVLTVKSAREELLFV